MMFWKSFKKSQLKLCEVVEETCGLVQVLSVVLNKYVRQTVSSCVPQGHEVVFTTVSVCSAVPVIKILSAFGFLLYLLLQS